MPRKVPTVYKHAKRHACGCERCGAYFLSSRKGTRFCTGTCRTVFNDRLRAERRRRDEAISKAMEARFADPWWNAYRRVRDDDEPEEGDDASVAEDEKEDDTPSFLRLKLTQG